MCSQTCLGSRNALVGAAFAQGPLPLHSAPPQPLTLSQIHQPGGQGEGLLLTDLEGQQSEGK